jgi:DMSO reductase anchor subunit
MHPAFSVVFLTTLIGAGQGLFAAIYLAEVAARLRLIESVPGERFLVVGALIAALLGGLGLIASFFHLGHPERAWRAAAKWRTSWLSREVLALPLFLFGTMLYGAAHQFGWNAALAIGALVLVACIALYACTAMIYACVKFLQEWASPLTVLNFFLLGSASGFTLAVALSAMLAPDLVSFYAAGALALTAAALVSRAASLRRNARLKPKSTLQSAIGIKHHHIEQKSQGFTGGSFNTREFFHGVSRTRMRAVKWTFVMLTFPAPALLLGVGVVLGSTTLLVAAFVVQYIGLLAERWFFLAQSNHPQNLYYQCIS